MRPPGRQSRLTRSLAAAAARTRRRGAGGPRRVRPSSRPGWPRILGERGKGTARPSSRSDVTFDRRMLAAGTDAADDCVGVFRLTAATGKGPLPTGGAQRSQFAKARNHRPGSPSGQARLGQVKPRTPKAIRPHSVAFAEQGSPKAPPLCPHKKANEHPARHPLTKCSTWPPVERTATFGRLGPSSADRARPNREPERQGIWADGAKETPPHSPTRRWLGLNRQRPLWLTEAGILRRHRALPPFTPSKSPRSGPQRAQRRPKAPPKIATFPSFLPDFSANLGQNPYFSQNGWKNGDCTHPGITFEHLTQFRH